MPHWGYATWGLLLVALVSGVGWMQRRRRPAISLGLLAFAVLLLPVSSLTWLGYDVLVSPRFLYIPMLGVALVFAACLSAIKERSSRSEAAVSTADGAAAAPRDPAIAPPLLRAAYGVSILVLLAFGVRSFVRSTDFDSEDAFWQAEITSTESYAPAQQYFITRELKAGRPRAALTLAHQWFQRHNKDKSYEPRKAELVINTLAALMVLTPDVDAATLQQLQEFAKNLAVAHPAALVLPRLGIELRIGDDNKLLGIFVNNQRQLLLIAAEAAVRVGQDAEASKYTREALLGCEDCWTILINAGLMLARASELDEAQEVAQTAARVGPPARVNGLLTTIADAKEIRGQLLREPSAVREAQYHAVLGSYGRAYAAAKPALLAPPTDLASVVRLAQLAYMAGDEATAHKLLTRVTDSEGARLYVADFATQARWQEQPLPQDTWLPRPSASL